MMQAFLALDGGEPVRRRPLPSVMDSAGRTFGPDEEAGVLRVLRSGMLSGVWGGEVPALTTEFATMLGSSHAVACSSGTAALHLAMAAVDPDPGDEIIVPPISDMGTVAPVIAQNAVPVFADVDPVTGCLSVEAVEAAITPRTRAIIVVHLFGKPAPVRELRSLADRHGVVLIEDCAQAYLAPVAEAYVGTIGHLGCFSLQQTKHVSTGDGGLVVTDDDTAARRMRLFADKGWPRDTGERGYITFGLNYRMTELVAAVARAQLGKLPAVVRRRRAHAQRLTAGLDGLPGLTAAPDGGDHVYWQYPLLIDVADAGTQHRFGAALTAEGVPAVSGYLARPLYAEPVLRERRTYGRSGYPLTGEGTYPDRRYPDGLCPNAEDLIHRRLVVLPWNENYSDEDVDDIATAVERVHAAVIAGAGSR